MIVSVGDQVRDDLRQRHGGRVTQLRPEVRPAWIDGEWPDGTHSTYGIDAAHEFLTVERRNIFGLADLFGLERSDP